MGLGVGSTADSCVDGCTDPTGAREGGKDERLRADTDACCLCSVQIDKHLIVSDYGRTTD